MIEKTLQTNVRKCTRLYITAQELANNALCVGDIPTYMAQRHVAAGLRRKVLAGRQHMKISWKYLQKTAEDVTFSVV